MLSTTDKITLQSMTKRCFSSWPNPLFVTQFLQMLNVLILKKKTKNAKCLIYEKELSFRKELKKQLKELQTDENFIWNGHEKKSFKNEEGWRTAMQENDKGKRQIVRGSYRLKSQKKVRKHFRCSIVTEVLWRKSEIKLLSVSILLLFSVQTQ